MIASVITFAFGIFWLQQQSELPAVALLSSLALGGTVALAGALWRPLRLLAPIDAFAIGIAWAGGLAMHRLDDALALESEVRDLAVIGVIAELPQRFDNGLRFDFVVEQAPAGVPRHISVAWYRSFRVDEENQDAELQQIPDLHAGERWRLTLRLKRPHGNFNPHGFDIEDWLLERAVRATGYVRVAPANQRLDSFVAAPGYAIERLRQIVRDRMLATLVDQPYAGILIALVIGDQQAIDADLWQVFSLTGLTHLMSISGVHVTMVAGVAYALLGWFWRRSSWLMLRLPAQQAAAVGGMFGALAYCLLAGFAVPAQRTLYMLTAVALALWTRRNLASFSVLAFALLVVLVLDPWAVLSAGFWLSFGCVAMLLFAAAGHLDRPLWLREWAQAQWAVTVGMVPVVLALFQQFSLVSPLANAVAIPLVSLVVTPMA